MGWRTLQEMAMVKAILEGIQWRRCSATIWTNYECELWNENANACKELDKQWKMQTKSATKWLVWSHYNATLMLRTLNSKWHDNNAIMGDENAWDKASIYRLERGLGEVASM